MYFALFKVRSSGARSEKLREGVYVVASDGREAAQKAISLYQPDMGRVLYSGAPNGEGGMWYLTQHGPTVDVYLEDV